MDNERKNQLYYGDNLDILRRDIKSGSVDMVYLDPPFNSKRNYSVIFQNKDGNDAQAQIEAFEDTWTWSQTSEAAYRRILDGGAPPRVADTIESLRKMLGTNDVLAYLVMMTERLVELHRVLKTTGTLWLHCDPTASHYLKIVLDSIFGPKNYLNEIVWAYRDIGSRTTSYYKRKHDIIFCYAKGSDWTHNVQRGPLAESTIKRYGPYFDSDGKITYRDLEQSNPGVFAKLKGVPDDLDEIWLDKNAGGQLTDWWTDISPLKTTFQEALGYPTQKPLALLERIIATSTDEGDVVLDPFCGCGTTIDAAQKLKRSWIGIDVTYLAIDLIQKRLRHSYGKDIFDTYEVHGIPTSVEAAQALFDQNPLEFERWAVSLVNGQPNERQVGDRGVDGRIAFFDGANSRDKILVSVKGGRSLNPAMARDLIGTVGQESAAMGLLITLHEPTRGIKDAIGQSGIYTNPLNGTDYPKVQTSTIAELLSGRRPNLPEAINPYMQAKSHDSDQLTLM